MTAADIRELRDLAELADRIAADCRSIARRPALVCDNRRLALAKPFLACVHRDVVWSFVPEKPANGASGAAPALSLRLKE